MALTLSLAEGDVVYVGDTPVKMTKIVRDEHFVLEIDGDAFDVVGHRGIEIVPRVVVSAGNRCEWEGEAQVVFTAPRDIRILRKALYDKERARVA